MSSIVPAMGRMRKTVHVSNAALLEVCSREKVSVVDHTDTFTARSGAPRKDLYRDQVHPRNIDTSRLVFDLQRGIGTRHRPARDPTPSSSQTFAVGTLPSRGAPHRQRHWPAGWISSRQWQRTSAPLAGSVDLFTSVAENVSTTGRLSGSLHVSGRERQHHWPAQWISSRQWQRTSAPLAGSVDLFTSVAENVSTTGRLSGSLHVSGRERQHHWLVQWISSRQWQRTSAPLAGSVDLFTSVAENVSTTGWFSGSLHVSGRERQHHWPAQWISSRQWQRTSAPLAGSVDLFTSVAENVSTTGWFSGSLHVSGRERQHHWPAQWISSRQWQRTSAPLAGSVDLFTSVAENVSTTGRRLSGSLHVSGRERQHHTGRLSGSLHVSGRERQHHSSVWPTCTNLHIVTDLPSLWTDTGPHCPQSTSHLPFMIITVYLGTSTLERHWFKKCIKRLKCQNCLTSEPVS